MDYRSNLVITQKIQRLEKLVDEQAREIEDLRFTQTSTNFRLSRHEMLIEELMKFHIWLDKQEVLPKVKTLFADILSKHI
jgi:hypothetical protein